MVYTREMPWMETHRLEQRQKFIADVASGHWSLSELCERFGVSRPTGYKWVTRYRRDGREALADRSRAPHACPHRTAAELEAQIVAVRREFGWGARKLLGVLKTRAPAAAWPARSTVNDILARHQLLRRQRRRPAWAHPGAAPLTSARPNQIGRPISKGNSKPAMATTVIP